MNSFRFAGFELDCARRQLLADGRLVALKPRAFDLLEALIRRSDRLVSKSELLEVVWPHVIVEENNVEVHISALRKVLGPQAVATVPGHGYRFTLLGQVAEPITGLTPAPAASKMASLLGNLPTHCAPLFGRAAEVEAVTDLVERCSLVSVVGPAGIGKTSEALTVAHGLRGEFRDGVWWIELAPISDPTIVALTIGRVLGEDIAPGQSAHAHLIDALRKKQLLLVVDNCEHLVSTVAELIQHVLSAAPGVRILATSQEALHLAEEQVIRLNPLSVPGATNATAALEYGAVALFVARARSVDPRFALGSHNVDDVIEICARLDGIPLALEFAAARVALLGVHGLRQRLDERLKLLAGGFRSSLPRHQTLRSALEWSYSLLSAEERDVFDHLGVFAGSFSLEAAQQLVADATADQWTALDQLASLVDKSLVLVERTTAPRYRLLESCRALALEHLERDGKLAAARRKHAQTMALTLASQGRRDPHRFERFGLRWLRIAPDLDNARAALTWACGADGDREIAIDLLGATHFMWSGAGCTAEADSWFRIIEPFVNDTAQTDRAAQFWLSLADLRMFDQLPRQAEAGLRAANLFRSSGDRFGCCLALIAAAYNLAYCGAKEAARDALTELERLVQPDWPPYVAALVDLGYGIWLYICRAGSIVEARMRLGQAAEKFRAGASHGAFEHAFPDIMIVHCHYTSRDFEAALRLGMETLELPFVRGSPWINSHLRPAVATALTALGRLDEAAEMLHDSVLRLKRSIRSVSWLFSHIAFLAARQGRFNDAARLIGFVDHTRSTAGSVWTPHFQLSYEMAIELVQGGLPEAEFATLRSVGRELTEEIATEVAFGRLGS
jgi:predicted ATPase/DNA-binding winged helix-turn-helix (wHTH) protein